MKALKRSMNANKHKRMLVISESLLAKYPDKTGYNFPRGIAFLGLGKTDKAEGIARDFLENDPSSLNGCRLMGRIFLEQGIGDSAVHYLNKANQREFDPYYVFLLGKAYNLTGAHHFAIDAFNSSLSEKERYAAVRERGVAYMGLGDTTSARMDFDKAIELSPKNPVNWNARAYHLWAGTNQHEKALVDYNQALRLNKNYAYAFNNRGWSHYKLGNSKGAWSDFKNSKRRLPNNPYLFWNQGLVAVAEKNDKACGFFQKALALGYANFDRANSAKIMAEHCPNQKPVSPVLEKPQKPVRSNAPGG